MGPDRARPSSPNPGSNSSLASRNLAFVSGVVFAASDGTNGTELWRSNGTDSGTLMVKDIRSGSSSSSPRYLRVFDSQLFFAASDGVNGTELWKSDGSQAGTTMVKDVWEGPSNSSPELLAATPSLFFSMPTTGSRVGNCGLPTAPPWAPRWLKTSLRVLTGPRSQRWL